VTEGEWTLDGSLYSYKSVATETASNSSQTSKKKKKKKSRIISSEDENRDPSLNNPTMTEVSPSVPASPAQTAPAPPPPSSQPIESPTAQLETVSPSQTSQTPLATAPIKAPETTETKWPTIEVHGSARFRQEEQRKLDYVSDRGFGLIRARLDITINTSPQFSIFVQPQFVKTMGEPYYTPVATGGTAPNALTLSSSATNDTPVLFHQGYFTYKPVGSFSLLIGRQALVYGNEFIIGQLLWNNVGRTFDLIKMRVGSKDLGIELLASKVIENNSRASFANLAGDRDLYSVYSNVNKSFGIDQADFYTFYLNDEQAKYQVALVGARLQSDVGSFLDYRIEAGQEFISTKDGQADAEIGLKIPAGIKPRIAFEAFTSGKDYYQFYPAWHCWLGCADMFGRRNVQGFAAHASIAPYKSANLSVSYRALWRTDVSAPVYQLDGVATWGSLTASQASEIAREIDVTFKTGLPYNVDLTMGVSPVFLGSYLTTRYGDVTPIFYYSSLEAKF
jgi:hypothetical protein